jgi:transcription elongation factor GreA
VSHENSVTWLTQEAFDRRTAELNQLSVEGRTEIAKRIEAAREEGDLKENGGYHAAKEEQGKIEARIRVLTELLRTAVVGEAPESTGVVEPGTVITATILGDVYSEGSPLGTAIIGLKVGEETSYTAPNGKSIAVKILKVETYVP